MNNENRRHALAASAQVLFTVASLVFPLLLVSCGPRDPLPLPDVDEIDEMRVDITDLNRFVAKMETDVSEEMKFTAPREHWKPILNALRPYKTGPLGRKGKVVGDIVLKLKNGEVFTIGVLVFGDDTRIQLYLGVRPVNVTHLGGDKKKLHRALSAAMKATREQKK